MGRRGQRLRIAPGIYRDPVGLAAVVKVGRVQRERRYPHDEPLRKIQRWQVETRAQLEKARPRVAPSTLTADVRRYLDRLDIDTIADRTREIEAWLPRFGERRRDSLTTAELDDQLRAWRKGGLSASTCNHRRYALSNLFRVLDGRSAANPVLDCVVFRMPDPQARALSLLLIDEVLDELSPESKTAIRLKLLRWTGMRPSQMGRLRPEDFELEAAPPSVIVPRGKRGRVVRLPLMPEAVPIAHAFLERGCFGKWSNASAGKALRRALKAANERRAKDGQSPIPAFNLYRIKHSVASRLRASGMDLADVQDVLGHGDPSITAIYAPPVDAKVVAGFQALRPASYSAVPASVPAETGPDRS